jgi:flagellar basal body P-ring protein FlgI
VDSDKQREKMMFASSLKKNMSRQISETKQHLLSLKKNQFETATRMTVLQNQQLTYNLDYQSKEIICKLKQSEKLELVIKDLHKECDLHKKV